MKPTKSTIRRLEVPFSKVQKELKVFFKTWQSDKETRYSLIFTTKNSYISISLSRQQLVLLKKSVNEFKF